MKVIDSRAETVGMIVREGREAGKREGQGGRRREEEGRSGGQGRRRGGQGRRREEGEGRGGGRGGRGQ